MMTTSPKEVQQFLDDLAAVNAEKYDCFVRIRKMCYETYPETEEKLMYGGIVFFFQQEMYSGLFAYKNHITLEFSRGYLMEDPENYLEGKGKYRRHLKIKDQQAVENKAVHYFIKQAVS